MKKAFTLIELLVVIAIIAIFAAILFPVFAQAKDVASTLVPFLGFADPVDAGNGVVEDNEPDTVEGKGPRKWYVKLLAIPIVVTIAGGVLLPPVQEQAKHIASEIGNALTRNSIPMRAEESDGNNWVPAAFVPVLRGGVVITQTNSAGELAVSESDQAISFGTPSEIEYRIVNGVPGREVRGLVVRNSMRSQVIRLVPAKP